MNTSKLLRLGALLLLCLSTKTYSQTLYNSTISTPTTYSSNVTIADGNVVNINNTTVTFNLDLTIQQRATLNINNSTIKMGEGSRIIIEHYHGPTGSLGGLFGGIMNVNNNSLITSTSSTDANMWQGIQFRYNATMLTGTGGVGVGNSTIEYAQCAFTSFDPSALNAYGGRIVTEGATFRNNNRCIRLEKANNFAIAGFDYDLAYNVDVEFRNTTFQVENSFTPNPNDLVYLNNCTAVPFMDCSFLGKLNLYPYTLGYNCVGINGINAGILVDRMNTTTSGCGFIRLRTGIVISNTLTVSKRPVIRHAGFYCRYATNLNGCLNPLVISNSFVGGVPPEVVDFSTIFLRNCTGYRLEANNINYDMADYNLEYRGIVVMNSGIGNNEIYRNNIQNCNLSIQSIGTNKSVNGQTGLKILCNSTILSDFISNHDVISVMLDPNANSNNGIHRNQFVAGTTSDLSAANLFVSYVGTGYTPTDPVHYYLQPGTNSPAQFLYKYNAATAHEEPTYRNFSGVTTTNSNTCPAHTTGATFPAFSFATFSTNIGNIESDIDHIETDTSISYTDTMTLCRLYEEHSQLIDSMILHYADINDLDSMILVYKNVSKGYHYKILLAAAYADKGQYSNALTELDNIAGNYTLTSDESDQIDHLSDMYEVLEWLAGHDDDWANLPEPMYASVQDNAEKDPMYAGAIARTLLSQFENYTYDPVYVMPAPEYDPLMKVLALQTADKLYPNPVHDRLYMNWDGAAATLTLTDMMGRKVEEQPIDRRFFAMDISSLLPGVYICTVHLNGKILYQQKFVKQ